MAMLICAGAVLSSCNRAHPGRMSELLQACREGCRRVWDPMQAMLVSIRLASAGRLTCRASAAHQHAVTQWKSSAQLSTAYCASGQHVSHTADGWATIVTCSSPTDSMLASQAMQQVMSTLPYS